MSGRIAKFALMMFCTAAMLCGTASAQNNGFFGVQRQVGGVKIDAQGVLSGGTAVLDSDVRNRIAMGLEKTEAEIKSASKLRMISLRGLEAKIAESAKTGKELPSEVNYMAGLQRIEYIILEPETKDIILAGPGEGFEVNDEGDVVGTESGTPVIQLQDFLVAMGSVDAARTGRGVSVSIDATEQGIQRFQQFFTSLRNSRRSFEPSMQPKVEAAMGQQNVSLTGVPTDSRFSRVLVAADYKMKRLAMGLDAAPIKNFPSFMEIAQKAKASRVSAAPRFWMECSYDSVAKSEDGNVWQIRGSGVRALTEEEKFDTQGKKTGKKVKQNRFAKQWADSMTERFEELAEAEPAFRELRNVMDLSVVAAIIKSQRLSEKVGLELPIVTGKQEVPMPSYSVPKVVPAQCSFVRISNSWLVSASGGVQLDSWSVAANTESVAEVGEVAKLASSTIGDSWWWNAEGK